MDIGYAIVVVSAGAKRTTITKERRRELYKLKQAAIEYGLASGEIHPNGTHCGLLTFICGKHRFHLPIKGAKAEPFETEPSRRMQPNKRLVYIAGRYLRRLLDGKNGKLTCSEKSVSNHEEFLQDGRQGLAAAAV